MLCQNMPSLITHNSEYYYVTKSIVLNAWDTMQIVPDGYYLSSYKWEQISYGSA